MSIKEKLEKNIYSLDSSPRILYMNRIDGIHMNSNAPYPGEKEALDASLLAKDVEIPTQKLKATSFGDWFCEVRIINSKHFDNREQFDNMYIEKSERTIYSDRVSANRISIQNALQKLGITVSINIDYYLDNPIELENDLNRKIDFNLDFNKENLKKLEQELFYNLMCKLFGKGESGDNNVPVEADNDENRALYNKAFMINDFRLLSFDGNDAFATAKRENYYLMFYSTF